jgi:hypothetical protein
MLDPVEALFSLSTARASDRAVFRAVIDLTNSTVAQHGTESSVLVDRLERYRSNQAVPVGHDPTVTAPILGIIIELLSHEDEKVIPALLEKLNGYHTAPLAATVLGWLGTRARPALPRLVGVASTGNPAVEAAKRAIVQIGGAREIILSALEDSLASNDDEVFRELSTLMRRAGFEASPAYLDVLRRASESANSEIRDAAVSALTIIEPL